MLMLHISDIHFKSPDCNDPFTDPDRPVRTRMMDDLREQVEVMGKVGAILVGGDIAYKAAADEYKVALAWLSQLAEISGCPKERIFVVPGNHDVDRMVIKASMPIRNAQNAIAATALKHREGALRAQLLDKDSGQSLLKPHAEYNVFAAPFNCQIWPNKPFWHQDVPLTDGVTLRLYGLTSTLLSGLNGNNDVKGKLYLSPLQTSIDPAANTINLVLSHHPVDWLEDCEAVDDRLNARAQIQLFGHKHKQRAVMETNYVRLGAGSINPSRSEQPYQPGYNLISLKVTGKGPKRCVDVEVLQRRMQDHPEQYIAISNGVSGDIFHSSISLPEKDKLPSSKAAEMLTASSPTEVSIIDGSGGLKSDAEADMGEKHTRELLYRFWRLTSSQRREIMTDLGLIENGEMGLPEPERYGRALIRAAEQNKIEDVATSVANLET